jgi:hypothetical protein
MRQVVGCGVVNIMVYIFITLHTALVVHVQLFMINFVLDWSKLLEQVMKSGMQFFLMRLVMFVCSVLYSDHLEHDLNKG